MYTHTHTHIYVISNTKYNGINYIVNVSENMLFYEFFSITDMYNVLQLCLTNELI